MKFSLRSGMFSIYWRVVIKQHRWYVFLITLLMLLTATLEVVTVGMGVPLIEAATSGIGDSQNPIVKSVLVFLQWLGGPAKKE